MCAFQSESTLYSSLNIKKLFAANSCNILILSDSSGIRTHNHLVRKPTLKHLDKLDKTLTSAMSTYIYGVLIVCYCHVMNMFQSESTLYGVL